MSLIRAVVVDDEARGRARMIRLLQPHADVVMVGEAATGAEAVQRVLALKPDLVFLDVRMPELSGTDAAAQIQQYLPERLRPALVFTTAHAEHAVRAFELEGMDYLLKPIERDRLAKALRRVRESVWARGGQAPAPAAPAPPERPVFLTGHHGAAIASVPVGGLRAIVVEEGVAWAHTMDGERTRLSGSLAELESELPSPPFVRVSRSGLVHIERVLRLHARGSSFEAELEGGLRVSVSRRRAKRLEQLLGLG